LLACDQSHLQTDYIAWLSLTTQPEQKLTVRKKFGHKKKSDAIVVAKAA
jgi:desulfoferrodoxin (superoxide reductase-like protein)